MQRLLIVLGVTVVGIACYAFFRSGGADEAEPTTAPLQVTPGSVYSSDSVESPTAAAAAPDLPVERPLLAAEPVIEPASPSLDPVAHLEPPAPSAIIEPASQEPPSTTAALEPERLAQTATGAGGAISRPGCRVSLNRMFLARGVENREPISVGTVFSSDDQRVYVFMDVNNANGPERDMVIQWDHLDSPHTYEQRIPAGVSPRWRTWVYHTMRRPLAGNWYVRVTDEAGCAVGEMRFESTPYRGRPTQSAGL